MTALTVDTPPGHYIQSVGPHVHELQEADGLQHQVDASSGGALGQDLVSACQCTMEIQAETTRMFSSISSISNNFWSLSTGK